MDRCTAAMLKHSVGWERFLRRTGDGTLQLALSILLACLMDERMKMVRNASGQEVISTTTLYFDGDDVSTPLISLNDIFTLPGGRKPLVLSLSRYYGENGLLDSVEVNF